MAPDRVEEWLELRNPLASSSGSRRFGGSDVIDIAPGATEPMVAATSNRVLAEMEDTALATSKPGYRLDSEKAKEYMKNIEQFRILVIGRANAGKTTILQRVCGSTGLPEVFDEEGNKIDGVVVQGTSTRGYHSIKHQFMFQSIPGFVFHDSCGFEAGSTKQFDEMKNFVIERAVEMRLKKRIHAIWYCIPMTECNRTVTAAEKKFFNECDTGHVPVIVLLTKVDTLNLAAIEELENESLEIEVTHDRVEQKERELLAKWLAHVKDGLAECKFPPRGYMPLQKMQEENADCTALMQCTADALNEKSLQRLLISTQQSNIMLCVKFAVQKTLRRAMELGFRHRLQLGVKSLEDCLLCWFPKCEKNFDEEFECLCGTCGEAAYAAAAACLGPVIRCGTCCPCACAAPCAVVFAPCAAVGACAGLAGLCCDAIDSLVHSLCLKCSQWGCGLVDFHFKRNNNNEEHPDTSELLAFGVDPDTGIHDVPQDFTFFGRFLTAQSIAKHSIGYLLIVEYFYFLKQDRYHDQEEALSLAVKKYNSSNMQTTISQTTNEAFHDHSGDMDGLCEAIIKVILENRMSNKL